MGNKIVITIKEGSAQNFVDARLDLKEVIRIIADALAVSVKDVDIEIVPVLK